MTTETVEKPVEATEVTEEVAPDQKAEYQELTEQLAEVRRNIEKAYDHKPTDPSGLQEWLSKVTALALENGRIERKMKKFQTLVDEEAMDDVAQGLQNAFKKGFKIPAGWTANVKHRGEGNTLITLVPDASAAKPVIDAIKESGLSSGFDMNLGSDGSYEMNPRKTGGGGGGGGKGWKSPSGETVKLMDAFTKVATATEKSELEGKSNSSQWQLKKKVVEKAGYSQ